MFKHEKKLMNMHYRFSLKKLLLISLSISILFSGIACKNNSKQGPQLKVVGQKIQTAPANIEKRPIPDNPNSQEISSSENVVSEKTTMNINNDIINSAAVLSSENDLTLDSEQPESLEIYNPENKIDPFMSLIKEEPKIEINTSRKNEKEKRIPRTPLERVDLSQLKLVGIIQLSSGNKGLVEEASGKGYIISLGTYMGKNSGRVVEITEDRVIVEEELEDSLGKLNLQIKELKFQKPFGEN